MGGYCVYARQWSHQFGFLYACLSIHGRWEKDWRWVLCETKMGWRSGSRPEREQERRGKKHENRGKAPIFITDVCPVVYLCVLYFSHTLSSQAARQISYTVILHIPLFFSPLPKMHAILPFTFSNSRDISTRFVSAVSDMIKGENFNRKQLQ